MSDRNRYGEKKGSHTNTHADGDVSRSRMASVFFDLRNVSIANRGRHISLPIANHEVVFPCLRYVALGLRAILVSDSGFGIAPNSQLGNLDLDLSPSADSSLTGGLPAYYLRQVPMPPDGWSTCCAGAGLAIVARRSEQEIKQHKLSFQHDGFLI